METITLLCTNCNKEINRTTHYWRRNKRRNTKNHFCSYKCNGEYTSKHSQEQVFCTFCNKIFFKSKSWIKRHLTKNQKMFCSRSCAGKLNKTKQPKIRFCTVCSKEYIFSISHKSKKYCEECRQRQPTKEECKFLTIEQLKEREIQKYGHFAWLASHVRIYGKSWNKHLSTLPCQRCGYEKYVELAHIKAIADFPDTATLGEINDPLNILVLCPNCHRELDNGLLKIDDIPSRLIS